MEQDIEKENERLKDLLYSKIMFIEQLKEDYRNLVKDIEEITKNYNEARDLAIEFRTDNKHLNDLLDNALKEQEELREEIKQLHNGRNPEELYTLFGKPIKYWEEIKAENERLKEKIKMYKSEDTRKHNIIMETLQHEKKALDVSIKYKHTLQEIKAIVCGNYEIIDPQGRKDILKLITKAEEE